MSTDVKEKVKEYFDKMYEGYASYVEPYAPYLLIIFTILFCYFYSMYILYRVEWKYILNEKARLTWNSENTLYHLTYIGICLIVLGASLYIYQKIAKMGQDEETGIYPRAFYMAFLFAPIFVATFFFVIMYRLQVIEFAQTPHLKRCLLAFAILIYLCLVPLYLFSSDKVKLSMINMYLLGFVGFLLAVQMVYLLYQSIQLAEQMSKDRFDTLSKVCLLGTRGTVETEPYQKSSQKCVCTEGFDCGVEEYQCLKEQFEDGGEVHSAHHPHRGDLSAKADDEVVEGFEDGAEAEDEEDEEKDNLKRNAVGIPTEYYNNNLQKYEDLYLRDFQYMGSFYSYLANTPDYGVPELSALRGVVKDFRTRFVHLDIFEDKETKTPIVRCEKMAEKATPLSLDECLRIVRQDGFYMRENTPPMFLYLSFHGIKSKVVYQKTYQILQKFFKHMLIDKLYGFNERNHQSLLAEMPIKDALGKVILLTDTYPTYTLLDEILNCNVKDPKSSMQLREYKSSYIQYDEKGMLLDYDKKVLIEEQKHKMFMYYSVPNVNYTENAKVQSKAGVFNPDVSDIFLYGGQMGLMYVYVPDPNMVECLEIFQKDDKMMILKPPSLRYIQDVNPYVVPESVTKDMSGSTGTGNIIQELRNFDLKFSA